jgi:hypothetical protein
LRRVRLEYGRWLAGVCVRDLGIGKAKDPKEVGVVLRSDSQAESDRYPVVPRSVVLFRLRAR